MRGPVEGFESRVSASIEWGKKARTGAKSGRYELKLREL